METLETSRVCRLCGQQSGICINIFDKNENHVKKISAVLPILVHEMDLLPKQMCHRCSYKLEEFHKFYSDCLKTDRDLKSQLSWMRKREVEEDVRVPMVQIENVKIKSEPPDYDIYELDPIVENVNYINSMSGMTYSMNNVRNNNVDPNRIIDVDECFTCDRLAELGPPCRCSYRKNTNSSKAAMAMETTVGPCASRSNTRSSSSKQKQNDAAEIVIKTEKPDVISEPRSLRPRNKSIDYIGTKRKKSMIVNPASVCRKISTSKKTDGQKVNGIVIDEIKIKKEPQDDIQRILRPRKLLVDYIGSKRKKTEKLEGNKNGDDRTKRRKSSVPETTSHIPTAKRFSCLFPNLEFKVKEEILSDNENLNVKQGAGTIRVVDSCVSNLSSLFDRETELAIKRENIKDGLSVNRTQASASGSQPVGKLATLKKFITGKTRPRKISARRISGTKCSPKYLRSQDLPLRNGKVKKTDSDHLLSLGSLKKRFLEQSKTGRPLASRNLTASKTRENANVIRVPTSLKTPSNIKQYCEKCNNSFMNRELYRLHACYTD